MPFHYITHNTLKESSVHLSSLKDPMPDKENSFELPVVRLIHDGEVRKLEAVN